MIARLQKSVRQRPIAIGAAMIALLVLVGFFAQPATSHASGDPVIVAAGDIACDPANSAFNGGNGTAKLCNMKETAALIASTAPAAVLAIGDTQYNCGGYTAFQESYALSWGQYLSITKPVPGNHEYLTSGGTDCDTTGKASGYFQYFGSIAGAQGKGYYSYNIGTWHIIALNSQCSQVGGCGAGSPQETWLRNDLAANSTTCMLAYWHIPRFSSGKYGDHTQYSQFWNDLYNANAAIILDGHDHDYERFAPQTPGQVASAKGIREFVVGTGGSDHGGAFTYVQQPNSQVFNDTTYGLLKLTLHSSSYDWQFLPEAGQTFTDSGTTNCPLGMSHEKHTPPSREGGVVFRHGQTRVIARSRVNADFDSGSTNITPRTTEA